MVAVACRHSYPVLYIGEPRRNGVAERSNRIFGYDEKYDKLLHFTDRSMDGSVKNRHSYEWWTGREPSHNHLRVWGCPAAKH